MKTAPVIAFDLDGTLVDTAPDLIGALNYILVREKMSPLPLDSARNLIGAGARRLLERGLEVENRQVTPAEMTKLTEDFIAYYADHIADESRPFEGLEATLDDLASRGYRLAVCTNKLEWLSRRLLDRLDLTRRFAVILRQTVARAGGAIASTIMVGDAGTDVGVARRAGVPVVGVSFGYTEVPIADLKPDRLIDHMDQLPTAIEELLSSPAKDEIY